MKIVRQEYEQISSAKLPGWLDDHLVDTFLKQALGVDYLKEYLNKINNQSKFSSIEEKLADIKNRIGFDVSNKLRDEIDTIEKQSATKTAKASCGGEVCSCGCEIKNVKTASESDRSELLVSVKEILRFIVDLVKDKPDCVPAEVFNKLSETSQYNAIKNKLDDQELRKFIETQISKSHTSGQSLRYIGTTSDQSMSDNDTADYYNHATPGDTR